MSDERTRELVKAIDTGFAVEVFLSGELGQLLQRDAGAELDALAVEMTRLDPDVDEDRKRMRTIRQRCGILTHWQEALHEYVQLGRNAQVQLEEGGPLDEGPQVSGD